MKGKDDTGNQKNEKKERELMRELLFRAKTPEGAWVEGDLIHERYGTCIQRIDETSGKSERHKIVICPETLCQFTGLIDKNNQKIWENDIVFVTDDDGCYEQVDTGIGEIEFFEGLWYVGGNVQTGLYEVDIAMSIEVIGNIFDDPTFNEVNKLAKIVNAYVNIAENMDSTKKGRTI